MRRNRVRACAFALVALLLAGSAAGDAAVPDGPVSPTRATAAPEQRWGSAAGRPHLEQGVVNRTLPQSHRGKHPRVQAPPQAANTASVTTGPTAARTGFDRATSRERVDARGPHERVYANSDGTETTEFSATPVNYRTRDGAFEPIDTTLTRADDGWRNTTNAVGLTLASHADGEQRVELDDRHTFGYRLRDAAPRPGRVERDQVAYTDARPGVDLLLQARPGGVKETLVLKDAKATRAFDFPLTLRGLRARLDGQTLVLADGEVVHAVVPPGDMVDAAGAVSRGVSYALVDGVLEVRLDQAWLDDPARVYPVEVDPTVALPVDDGAADAAMSVRGPTSVAGGSELRVGQVAGVSTASYVRFGSLVDRLRNHVVFGAQLQVVEFDANSCRAAAGHGAPGGAGVDGDGLLQLPRADRGRVDWPAGRSRTATWRTGQSSSQCPAAAEVFDLGGDGTKLVQGWVDGTAANHGLSLRADVADPLSGKRFTGTGTANPPRLFVTHSPYNAEYAIPNPVPNPPVLQNQDGKVKVTVTNKGAEAWAPADYYLAYRAYNAKTGAAVGQQRAAYLPGTVARGAKVTRRRDGQGAAAGYVLPGLHDGPHRRRGVHRPPGAAGAAGAGRDRPPAGRAGAVPAERLPHADPDAAAVGPRARHRRAARRVAAATTSRSAERTTPTASCFDLGLPAKSAVDRPGRQAVLGQELRRGAWSSRTRATRWRHRSPGLDADVPQPELTSRAAGASARATGVRPADRQRVERRGGRHGGHGRARAERGAHLQQPRPAPRRRVRRGLDQPLRHAPDPGRRRHRQRRGHLPRRPGRCGSAATPTARTPRRRAGSSALTQEAGGWKLADRSGTAYLFTGRRPAQPHHRQRGPRRWC